MISIKGIDKAILLAALYNNASAYSPTFLSSQKTMTPQEAKEYLIKNPSLDLKTVKEKQLNINISGDSIIDTSSYHGELPIETVIKNVHDAMIEPLQKDPLQNSILLNSHTFMK